MRTLYGSVLQNRVSVSLAEEEILCDELRTLLGYMTGYFPFRPARREIKVEACRPRTLFTQLITARWNMHSKI